MGSHVEKPLSVHRYSKTLVLISTDNKLALESGLQRRQIYRLHSVQILLPIPSDTKSSGHVMHGRIRHPSGSCWPAGGKPLREARVSRAATVSPSFFGKFFYGCSRNVFADKSIVDFPCPDAGLYVAVGMHDGRSANTCIMPRQLRGRLFFITSGEIREPKADFIIPGGHVIRDRNPLPVCVQISCER